ncbi:MAG: MFS transporter [Corynebacterium sp.]|uniref:MFS transporter n=1 Tax=Corynebacterium sp. TaxID=1720 RepID=UPI0026476F16|nr:MFS transporter [Corynebacterium sp.]MDN6304501.1 MFS transporter [Corynebacterium sp.]MDN6352718.1 MFS transporter [Corynebacterium sp.]MDN6366300.1 MFS transporter [Corynebacterium sp.]MDN6395094.1 MFS transporter [Corynebacterium sp.]
MTTDPTNSFMKQSGPAPQIRLVLTAVFLVYLAQMTLNPIIAPLSREVGLAEWQVGVTISAAALMLVTTSQLWGRRSQSWGRKPVLVAALVFGALTTALFALVSWLGMIGAITGGVLFVLFVLLRGVGFGTAIAAVPPTAQAYIADVTDDEATRVKGMAGVGAVQGMAMIGGSIVGGLLAAFGLLTPLIVVPVMLIAGFVIVATRLRREPRTTLIEQPRSVRPTDARVWPFLLAGFGIFTSLGFIQVIIGFIVQDRLGLDTNAAGVLTGAALLVAGIGTVIAQAVIVPRSGWGPATLLRVGGGTSVAGFLLLTPDIGSVALFASLGIIGLGIGLAMPGYTAGPTLLVDRDEQGGLAGLSAANIGLTFVVAPTAGSALYGLWPPLPVIVGTAIMTAVTIFVLAHPRFRRLPAARSAGAAAPVLPTLD